VLVASRDDTYSGFTQSEALARALGAKLIDAGAATRKADTDRGRKDCCNLQPL
jgi:predicted alpha/beta hydrolase family esterase